MTDATTRPYPDGVSSNTVRAAAGKKATTRKSSCRRTTRIKKSRSTHPDCVGEAAAGLRQELGHDDVHLPADARDADLVAADGADGACQVTHTTMAGQAKRG